MTAEGVKDYVMTWNEDLSGINDHARFQIDTSSQKLVYGKCYSIDRANIDPYEINRSFEVTFNEIDGSRTVTIVAQAVDDASQAIGTSIDNLIQTFQ